jgi:hypothetical protein
MSHPSPDKPTLSSREQADLSALADGTIDPARKAEVEARIAASPELTALYHRERRVVELVHRASERTHAPLGLRERIAAQRPSPAKQARRRLGYAGGLAAALAVVALALVLLLPGGSPGAPSVSEAAALASLGATQSAPMPDPSNPAKLGSDVEDVYFPNWEKRFNAAAVGQRTDTVGGRPARTVYYRMHGKTIAYTIVGEPALSGTPSSESWLNGTELWTFKHDGRHVVTWKRDGRTCILSSVNVATRQLQRLAAWPAAGIS